MPLRLSQTHLSVLTLCPRKFQYLYLDQIGGIAPPTQQQVWGNQFHQLMQQQDLGLPLIQSPDPHLARCVTALQAAAPHLFDRTLDRQSEYRLGLRLGSHVLVAVCDRLVVQSDRATLYDWKTYARPLSSQQLAQSWQTRLYLYVLAEAGPYSPSALSMVYWFVRLTPDHPAPQSVTLPYSAEQHQRTHAELTRLVQQLDQWLERYDQQSLPQLPLTSPHCTTCPFALCCDRLPQQRQAQRLLSIDEVEEVPL